MNTEPEANSLSSSDENKMTPDDRSAHAQCRWSDVLLTGKLFMPKPVHDGAVPVGSDPVDAQPVKDVMPDSDDPKQNAAKGNFITP